MTTLYISEFTGLQAYNGSTLRGNAAPVVALEKGATTQTLAISAASAASAPVNISTRIVRLLALADCHIAIDRAATTADLLIPAGQVEYFGVGPGAVLHVIGA